MARAKKAPPEPVPIPSEPERYIDLHEAAAFLQITSRALYLRIYKGVEIPCVKIGYKYRFQKSALAAWADSNPKPLHQDEIVSPAFIGRRKKRATP